VIKKILFSLLFISVYIFSKDVEFNFITQDPKRIMPNSHNEVISYNRVIKESVKSVVNISTKKHVKVSKKFNTPFPREFVEPFLRDRPKLRPEQNLGSGVILTSDGYIVTNSHVIRGSDEITVSIANTKKEYSAKVIGVDEDSDLAVIKIDAKNLPAIKIANSNSLLIGDIVFAIGNPFGVGESVTSGIISALNKNRVGLNQYENFIQTDASINPGNSGGALVDSRGALIGINSAIISKSGGNDGIGLAIPVDMVKDITKKLIRDGRVSRGYIGVNISDLTKGLTSIYNHKAGAVIIDIEPNSPAKKYGLKRGDLIYSINGKSIDDANSLKQTIGSYQPNDKISLDIERDKKDISIVVTLASRDNQLSLFSSKLSGLSISNLTNELRYTYRIPYGINGVLIKDVHPNSKSELVGFQSGDIIVQIEGENVNSVQDVYRIFKKYRGKPKRVYINRYGTILMLVTK
jgi:serine protease Do